MATSANKAKDPVCGMSVDAANCDCKAKHGNKEYCFCCQGCMEAFKKNPKKFSKK